jgi:NTP pyrophosphatase (non-canonical NTP hydrolase)
MNNSDPLRDIAQRLDPFPKDRAWQQFHSPKYLASAPLSEAGELLEHFQWVTEQRSCALAPEKRDAVAAEVADALLYLIQLSTARGIDPIEAAQAKLKLNELKCPVDSARSIRKKYDEL